MDYVDTLGNDTISGEKSNDTFTITGGLNKIEALALRGLLTIIAAAVY